MKLSNKLLLGGILTAVLLIAALHITLYAKYRSGDHVPFTGELQSMVMQAHPHVKFVSIQNVENVSIRFGDSLKTGKTEDKDLTFRQQGDTLHIKGSDSSNKTHTWNEVHIQVPQNMPIAAANSELYFSGKGTAANALFLITLNNSQAHFRGDPQVLPLGNISLTAINKSKADFQNSRVGQLDVVLKNSSLEDNNGTIDSLAITTDAASHISLQTKHLIKAKINTAPQN